MRIFLKLFLAALLLVAQHAALTHAIWHAHGHEPVPQQHEENNGKGSFQSGLCDLHGAFYQVACGVPTESNSHAEQRSSPEQASAPALPCIAVLSPVPLSRGPPGPPLI